MPLKSERIKLLSKALFFAVVVYIPLFLHLENLPIRLWDESRLAESAYEMQQNGNYLVPYYQGSPEMWSTKPPLMIWLQAFCLQIFGMGELAIRLPAALAAFFTCVSLLWFGVRFLKSYWLGMIAVLILVTSSGYVDVHVTRTGDYESLLVLCTTLYALVFFVFLETNKIKFLYLTVFFLILAALTKGIAAFLFAPVLLLYPLIKRKLVPLLKNPHLYIGIFLVILFVGGYYLLREHFNPGYIKAVAENELGGRYLKALEGHNQPYWFYFFNLVNIHFTPWYLLIPLGVLFGIFHQQPVIRNLSLYLTLLIVVYFFAVSGAKTRIEWYDAPMFPFLALLAAIFLWYWFDFISKSPLFSYRLQKNIAPYAMLFLIFVIPYSKIADKVYKPKEGEWVKEYTIMGELQKGLQGRENLNNYFVCFSEIDEYGLGVSCSPRLTPAIFYIHGLKDKGVAIDLADSKTLHPGDIAMAYQTEIKNGIEGRYETEVLEEKNNVKVYLIEYVYDCSLLNSVQ